MLLKADTLRGIQAGTITLAFRRQKRPTVKTGGTLKTRIGVLSIDAVREVTMKSITERDAKAAGHVDRAELLALLREREGKVYRVELSLAGADPRIALRQQSKLTDDEFDALHTTLQRMDARSRGGAWTQALLELIRAQPATRAPELAESIGMATAPFKQRVRRLKEHGLTESLEVGYRLSPRGKAYLRRAT